jgi:photosystem II stability/assembly factor-like uncharacterized protein
MEQNVVSVAVSRFDEDLLLAKPAGQQLLRSSDGGVSWESSFVDSGLGKVNAIQFAPWDPALVLLSTSGGDVPGIYRSTDAGLTWALSRSGLESATPYDLKFDPVAVGKVYTAAGAIYEQRSVVAFLEHEWKQLGNVRFRL